MANSDKVRFEFTQYCRGYFPNEVAGLEPGYAKLLQDRDYGKILPSGRSAALPDQSGKR